MAKKKNSRELDELQVSLSLGYNDTAHFFKKNNNRDILSKTPRGGDNRSPSG